MGYNLSKYQVLVLNNDYQALGICSVERAFCLVYLRKAELIKEYPDVRLRASESDYPLPSIIRLRKYIPIPYRKVHLSRQNVFRRDENTCLYCGTKQDLTIDHVIPKSLGGKDSWENLATACQSCNAKKGHFTPEQVDMKLAYRPFKPSFVMFLSNFSGAVLEDWKPYLYMS